MATPSSCVEFAMEETPRYEGAVTTTPYRVSTTKVWAPIQSVGYNPNPSYIDRADEIRGIPGAVPQLLDAFAPAGTLALRGYLNALPFFLHAAGWEFTRTAGDGIILDPDSVAIPVGANRWVGTKRTTVTAQTFQMQQAFVPEQQFFKGQGVGLGNWSLNRDGSFTADLLGLVMARLGADPNLTPAYDVSTIWPIRRGDLTVTWLGGTAAIDDFTITGSNPLEARNTHTLATPSFFPDVIEHTAEYPRIGGTIPKSVIGATDYDALVAASTFTAEARWKTIVNIGATGYKYTVWFEFPKAQYIGGTVSDMTNARRTPATFDWQAAWDEGSGFDCKITIVNAQATSLEVYA